MRWELITLIVILRVLTAILLMFLGTYIHYLFIRRKTRKLNDLKNINLNVNKVDNSLPMNTEYITYHKTNIKKTKDLFKTRKRRTLRQIIYRRRFERSLNKRNSSKTVKINMIKKMKKWQIYYHPVHGIGHISQSVMKKLDFVWMKFSDCQLNAFAVPKKELRSISITGVFGPIKKELRV